MYGEGTGGGREIASSVARDWPGNKLASGHIDPYIAIVCGRVIQSSGPLRYAIVNGVNVRDSRVHNYPPRWNAAPSQELLVTKPARCRSTHCVGGSFLTGAKIRLEAAGRSTPKLR